MLWVTLVLTKVRLRGEKMNKVLRLLNGLLQYDKTMTVAQAAQYLKGLR